MPRLVRFVLAAALLCPSGFSQEAWAQVQPHRAEYALRLGAAANAPRIGTAVHDLSQDCAGWHLKRDIKTEIALTTSWRMSLASKMDGDEQRNGNGFRFSTLQIQNGSQREIKGRVQRKAGETRAEIVLAGSPPNQFVLPPPTLMPVAATWPVFMTFTRGREQDQRPLFTVSALIFDNGVLDRLTVETGLLSVTADLQALEMRPAAVCPRS